MFTQEVGQVRSVDWLSFFFLWFPMSVPSAGAPDYGELLDDLARTSVSSRDRGEEII